MKNSIFARFARAFFMFWHFVDILVLSTTWNDLFCSCVDDVSMWWQMFNFVFSCPKRWFQFNSRIIKTHFSSIMSLNNWKMIAETRSHIFKWRSRFRRRRVCLSSLIIHLSVGKEWWIFTSPWIVLVYTTQVEQIADQRVTLFLTIYHRNFARRAIKGFPNSGKRFFIVKCSVSPSCRQIKLLQAPVNLLRCHFLNGWVKFLLLLKPSWKTSDVLLFSMWF